MSVLVCIEPTLAVAHSGDWGSEKSSTDKLDVRASGFFSTEAVAGLVTVLG